MTVRECYDELGADFEGVVSRLVTEERVKKFVTKLPKDDSFERLSTAMAEKNAEQAFMGAHTMKGIAMNLGLTGLAETASALTEELRQGSITPEAGGLFTELEKRYRDTVRLIGMLSESGGTAGEQ